MIRSARRQPPRLGLALMGWLVLAAPGCDDDTTSPGRVPIRSDFGSKIVYGTSRSLDVEALREHCRGLNGTFNECGTTCRPGAGACPAVCAYTCEEIPGR